MNDEKIGALWGWSLGTSRYERKTTETQMYFPKRYFKQGRNTLKIIAGPYEDFAIGRLDIVAVKVKQDPQANKVESEFNNKKYLIYVTAQVGGSDAAEDYAIRAVHGNTPFDGSEFIYEPAGGIHHTYAWFTVWNPTTVAEANEDVKLQYKSHTGVGGDEGRFDQITMFAMEISERLTEEGMPHHGPGHVHHAPLQPG